MPHLQRWLRLLAASVGGRDLQALIDRKADVTMTLVELEMLSQHLLWNAVVPSIDEMYNYAGTKERIEGKLDYIDSSIRTATTGAPRRS